MGRMQRGGMPKAARASCGNVWRRLASIVVWEQIPEEMDLHGFQDIYLLLGNAEDHSVGYIAFWANEAGQQGMPTVWIERGRTTTLSGNFHPKALRRLFWIAFSSLVCKQQCQALGEIGGISVSLLSLLELRLGCTIGAKACCSVVCWTGPAASLPNALPAQAGLASCGGECCGRPARSSQVSREDPNRAGHVYVWRPLCHASGHHPM